MKQQDSINKQPETSQGTEQPGRTLAGRAVPIVRLILAAVVAVLLVLLLFGTLESYRQYYTLLSGMAAAHLIFFQGIDQPAVAGLVTMLNGLCRPGAPMGAALPEEYWYTLCNTPVLGVREVQARDWENFETKYRGVLSLLPTAGVRRPGVLPRLDPLFLFGAAESCPPLDTLPPRIAEAAVILDMAPADLILDPAMDAGTMPPLTGPCAARSLGPWPRPEAPPERRLRPSLARRPCP